MAMSSVHVEPEEASDVYLIVDTNFLLYVVWITLQPSPSPFDNVDPIFDGFHTSKTMPSNTKSRL